MVGPEASLWKMLGETDGERFMDCWKCAVLMANLFLAEREDRRKKPFPKLRMFFT